MGFSIKNAVKERMSPAMLSKVRVLKQEATCRKNRDMPAGELVEALGEWFLSETGEVLDLHSPKTFNQKTQWLKVNDSTKIKGQLADKYLVRQYIEKEIGADYLVPLLGVYDSVDDIDFDELPDRFVLKATHGSGWNIVVSDKAGLSVSETKWKLKKWLDMDFAYLHGYELHYNYCQPRIIAEEYLDDLSSGSVDDYKVYCFNNGEPIVCVCRDRFSDAGIRTSYYDKNWEKLPIRDVGERTFKCERPPHLDEMIRMSELLARDFAFVRVDWYESTHGLLFGEMTFTSSSGTENFDPPEWNIELGKRIDLSVVGGRHGVEQ